jgi:aminoglycoside phosphotransferase family enzyme
MNSSLYRNQYDTCSRNNIRHEADTFAEEGAWILRPNQATDSLRHDRGKLAILNCLLYSVQPYIFHSWELQLHLWYVIQR